MKTTLSVISLLLAAWLTPFVQKNINTTIVRETTVDSLGACQGASYQNGRIFLYGDREVGMIREYKWQKDSLVYTNKEYKLTQNGQDVIGHPTGIAFNGSNKVFIGNSVRLNKEGTQWKAVIYQINWPGLQNTGTLDGNIISTIDDDACIQGTRPEYVKYNNKWYLATADYGNKGNEVRLYDPEKLARCKKTSEPGVLYKKFTCTPWVQNLYWVSDKGILILIQNQVEGRKWRLTYVDLKKSVDAGGMQVIKQIDIDSRPDELEGFTFINGHTGIAVTSSRKNNVSYTNTTW
ncbi:hypothetical protein GWR56_13090 [Mucilaginibacter sp. 14171R-50]|uniref:hypothetical protein n=1 Tax=Mucilaginibacter sp. 14171R-50 TaxID=2703789 RepID=UPI00138D976D|nr:hypothetical protein [Mucilaginibacter sp. 14171R-50]QHS56425.1 hypothetical protein GWR56_13090 [Mucilaginibacter sp. 14171R-50]